MFRFVLCCLFCLTMGAPAWGAESEQAVGFHSVQAEFIQEKHLPILARPLVSHGLFVFQAPGSLRWEYLAPLRSVLLMHNGGMTKLIERDGRLQPDPGVGIDAMRIILEEIGSWLDGRFSDNPLFILSRDDADTVILTPREAGLQAIISRIELRQGQEVGILESVTIVEGVDSFTRLTFNNEILDAKIPVQTFVVP